VTRRSSHAEAGSAIVEFAVIALVMWLLFAAVVEFGRAFAASHVLQGAAREAAHELSLTPLPAEAPFADAVAAIFDARALVIDLDAVAACGRSLDQHFATLPLVNRLLRPLYVHQRLELGGATRDLLRYPGALLRATGPEEPCASGFTVAVPHLDEASGGLEWVPVVEEMAGPEGQTRFPLSEGGWVALRIQYPFQAVSWSAWHSPDGTGEAPFRAERSTDPVFETNAAARGGELIDELDASDSGLGAYGGRFGLGRQLAQGEELRPFRRLLAGQAAFRREVIE
jgi:hypothetical protein